MSAGVPAPPQRPERLRGRTILVTGSTGIAAASAERFAQEGAAVFVVSREEEHCRSLVERLRSGGGRAEYLAGNLAEEPTAAQAVSEAVDAFDRLDGLFNVAGGSGRRFGDGPLHEATLEGWRKTFALNLDSLFLMTRAAVRAMLAQPRDGDGMRGAIVNMSSILAFHPAPRYFPTHAYAAAKGAIATLTLTAAAYYAPEGIRVNGVVPSLVTTPMSARAAEDEATVAYARRRQPLPGGFMAPEDVAAAAAYLLSAEARYVTGQMLTIDGGWSVSEGAGA